MTLAALSLAAAAHAASAELPASVEAFAGEQSRVCAAAGGTARVGPAFATAVDLNGDGALDYVVDLAGIECANAWGTFCGPEGCQVSVWIAGPGGPARAWDGIAQGWRIEGAGALGAVVVDQSGAACAGSTNEAGLCTQRLAFEAPPPPPVAAPAPVAAVPLDAPTAPGWTLRDAPEGGPVAISAGPGGIASIAAFCQSGQPRLAATLRDGSAAPAAEIGFAFSNERVAYPARREETLAGALVIELDGLPLTDLLSGRDASVALSLDGVAQGVLSLRGSTRAIRDALAGCADG